MIACIIDVILLFPNVFQIWSTLDGYEEIFCGSINIPSTSLVTTLSEGIIVTECLLCQTLGYEGLGTTQIVTL